MRASIVILAVVAAGIAASFNDTDSNPALLRRMRRQCPCFGQVRNSDDSLQSEQTGGRSHQMNIILEAISMRHSTHTQDSDK